MFLYLLYIAIILCVVHLILNYNEKARMIKKIPGPKMDFIIGNARTLLKGPEEIMLMGETFAKTFNGIYGFWLFPYGNVVIFNPEDIENIISGTKYTDKYLPYEFLKPWLGEGLLISSGAKWQERRKILTPAFHFNILKQYCTIIDENCDEVVDSLKSTAGKALSLLPVLSKFTLNTICETSMGTKLSEDTTLAARSYKQALHKINKLLWYRMSNIVLYLEFIFYLTIAGRELPKQIKITHSFTESVIKQRRQYLEQNGTNLDTLLDDDDTYVYKKKKGTVMLDLLLSAGKEGLIDNNGIREEVDTFMFEGHDTTASALTFCLMLLANHKEHQDKIREEYSEIFGESKRQITLEDLNKMKYLERCVKESLRIYPPVPYMSRIMHEPVILSNYTIPVGTHVHIRIIDLHRSEKYYENPEKFDPDRFLPENCLKRHPYAYIPFSAGPRNCIGQKFAMMEMKLMLTKILQQFDLVSVTRPEDIRFTANLVLTNKGPTLVNFIRRE